MSCLICTSSCPFFTSSPSLTVSWVISPETSGAILTSVEGFIFPEAVTIWTMVAVVACWVSTWSIFSFDPKTPQLFIMARMMITTMISGRMYFFFLLFAIVCIGSVFCFRYQ